MDASRAIGREAVEQIRRHLLERQRALLDDVDGIEDDLQLIETGREAEVEARAQAEAMARLLDHVREHDRHELEEIYRALAKIPAGLYGRCERCGEPVAGDRLRATPEARYCIACQRAVEASPASPPRPFQPRSHRPIPEEYRDLDDDELAQAVRERLDACGDPDFGGVAIRCHGGVVRLSGEIPSDAQRQVLRQIVTDGMALELLDRLRVAEPGAEAPARAAAREEAAPVEERIPVGRGMRPLAPEPWAVPEDEGEPPETVPDVPVAEEE